MQSTRQGEQTSRISFVFHLVSLRNMPLCVCLCGEREREREREREQKGSRDLKGNDVVSGNEVPPAPPLAEPVLIDVLIDSLGYCQRQRIPMSIPRHPIDGVTDDSEGVVLGKC